MAITEDKVWAALERLIDPVTQKSYVAARSKNAVRIKGGKVHIEIELDYPAKTRADAIRDEIAAAVHALFGVEETEVGVISKIAAHAIPRGRKLLPGVRNIVAVASGKGGVGKSTTAVNIALALAQEGATVGLLDADLYGPSIPQMLGVPEAHPESPDWKSFVPIRAHGLQAISVGFLVDVDSPMIWRGPMVAQVLEQLLTKSHWNDLDYLVVDMPPGTGDAQLTLAQKAPVTGALIVTTPQDIALIDARKGLKMFEKVGVPILGVVENMSTHICPECGHEEPIFGQGGAEKICDDFGVAFLGALPLDRAIREMTDAGRPTLIGAPQSRAAENYRTIACRVAAQIATLGKEMSGKFPNIVVRND
ncbi:MAG: iron-sulfur cluster carrier protein ApbC [Candidatus Accumulibacter sp.]|jgi:ATP-binding protein involved in chromosome partitioning|nr:iron-sulfur cluster carrier protein ApbC [Accumulibacter sp.]